MRKNGYLYPLSVILLSLFIVFNSCDFNPLRKIKYNRLYHQYNQKLEYRDSLYVMYTVNLWTDSNAPGFHNLSIMYNFNRNQTHYFIGGAFYSPDKRKMIVWVGYEMPNAELRRKIKGSSNPYINKICPVNSEKIYGMTAVVGIRNDTNKVWQLYPLTMYSVECYPSKKEAIISFSSYYFGGMKNSCPSAVSIKHLDSSYGGKARFDLNYPDSEWDTVTVLKELGYNLQDKKFWTKSLIWEKGAQVPGYYPFQLIGNDGLGGQIQLPRINYPDSILRLYPATARILSCGKSE